MWCGKISLARRVAAATEAIGQVTPAHLEGCLGAASGRGAEIAGLAQQIAVGDRIKIHRRHGVPTVAEIVAIRGGVVHSIPFSPIDGLGKGAIALAPIEASFPNLAVSDDWLGRVVDPLGHPLDLGPPLAKVKQSRLLRIPPPEAMRRARLGQRMSLGVRAVDLFATCRLGQRVGLFAGSGVGKSTLLAMLAHGSSCDIAVIAFVGERGHEVREFLEDDLGASGLARSVVVVATSDAGPLMRREAAYAAMTIAEHFRDSGKKVLLLIDSLTRFCHALREIALSAGEPPANRGYPPTVFAELPRLLERAGPGSEGWEVPGHISAVVTVLVDGDDLNEPIADNVRGLLDGHIVLDRRIAERGRFPAIDLARSLSRSVPECNSPPENQLILRARQILATHADVAELVRLGAYRPGTDAAVDEALILAPRIEAVLRQGRSERSDLASAFAALRLAIQ